MPFFSFEIFSAIWDWLDRQNVYESPEVFGCASIRPCVMIDQIIKCLFKQNNLLNKPDSLSQSVSLRQMYLGDYIC